jgi:hypothetical protein
MQKQSTNDRLGKMCNGYNNHKCVLSTKDHNTLKLQIEDSIEKWAQL